MNGRVLATTRVIVLALTIAPFSLAGVMAAIRPEGRSDTLVVPAVVVGIVSLGLGYHLYRRIQGRARGSDPVRGAMLFRAGTIVSLACTESATMFGIVAYFLSGKLQCLVGLLLHALLAGAVWPTEERLRTFLEGDLGGGTPR